MARRCSLLAEVVARQPGWGRVPLLEANIADLERNPGRAIDGYLKAIEAGERHPETIGRAVQLLKANSRTPEADRLIQGLVAEAPPLRPPRETRRRGGLRQGDQPAP